MSTAKDLYERVHRAQAQLGQGEVEEALAQAAPLREEAVRLLNKGGLLTSFDRTYATLAYTYSSVTLILGMAEARSPGESIPRIRQLAVDAARRHRKGTEIWKALAAAAEMLARAGDTDGSVWAVKKARQLHPDEEEIVKLAGGIQSMYPAAFAQVPEEVPDEPPPIPAGRR